MAGLPRAREDAVAYGFVSPWIIGFVLFSGIPILLSFLLSLTTWDLLGDPTFVGLDNYTALFAQGSAFANTLKVTFIFTMISVAVTVTGSFGLAVLLNLKVRHIGIFRFAFFLPAVVPAVAMAAVFNLMFSKELGVVNYVLSTVGVQGPNWLGSSTFVWVVIGLMTFFSFSTGQMMLIFDAGLKDVPAELYEAASLDGANGLQRLTNVTLPAISPLILFNGVVATVGAFSGAFNLIYPLTGGGPGTATRVLSLDIYEQAFRSFNMGRASAMAVVLFAIVAVISFLQFRLSERHVNYE